MSIPYQPDGDAERIGEARENLEGSYTEVDGEGPHERTVHGQYTETEGVGPEEETEGTYTDAQEPVAAPDGEYTEGDYDEP
ncbi:hypothetical protein [Leifsonia sp. fls2-241-R2A-40a]|uniref:hypothetical protein n=1 Tax=Leifsonia sp. fls2-241-R2A-40a TaxID=3040290 RepID=UPI00254B218C|nr:hypothetical protein [Leifsonia sp. fls2-241-R2A-40a]